MNLSFLSDKVDPSSMAAFFSHVRRFRENVLRFIPRLRFLFVCCKVEISSRPLIPLFRPGSVHSGWATWDDCDQMFPDELRVSSFPDRFLHYAWTATQSAHSDFDESRVYACLGATCHLHFWQNDRGLLRATAVTRGWNGHRNRSQHTKLTLEKKILPPLLQGFELATFRSRVQRSNQQTIQHNNTLYDQFHLRATSHSLKRNNKVQPFSNNHKHLMKSSLLPSRLKV